MKSIRMRKCATHTLTLMHMKHICNRYGQLIDRMKDSKKKRHTRNVKQIIRNSSSNSNNNFIAADFLPQHSVIELVHCIFNACVVIVLDIFTSRLLNHTQPHDQTEASIMFLRRTSGVAVSLNTVTKTPCIFNYF